MSDKWKYVYFVSKSNTMMKNFFFCILCIVVFIGCKTKQQETVNNRDNNYDIYLLIGQSNMAGRAPIEKEYTDTLQNVLLYKGIADNKWEKAANPLNKYSTMRKEIGMQRLGPGYSFAKDISEFFPQRTIALVVNARGGTSIQEWRPGDSLYIEALNRAKEASQYGKIRGILWHQGEANAKNADWYTDSLAYFIKTLRSDLKDPEIPFVAGQIYPRSESYAKFNEMLLNIPSIIPYSAVVSSDSTSSFDNLHFDAESQNLMGKRYAEAMYKLLRK